jgi:hypothetical protein
MLSDLANFIGQIPNRHRNGNDSLSLGVSSHKSNTGQRMMPH